MINPDDFSRILNLPPSTETRTVVHAENCGPVHVGNVAHLHGPILIKQYLNQNRLEQEDPEENDEIALNIIEAIQIPEENPTKSKYNFPPCKMSIKITRIGY
jgi:hypothetical protein